MEDRHVGFSVGGAGSRKEALEAEDLQEEEVWATMKASEGSRISKPKSRKNFLRGTSSSSSSSSVSSAWRSFNSSTPKSIRGSGGDGGGQQEFFGNEKVAPQQSSAPVDIPGWSKTLKRRSKRNLWDDACDAHGDGDDYGGDEMVPPHEYLGRRLASTHLAPFSVCEGVGRTLKGRDLSKVRNAILTKTGFIE